MICRENPARSAVMGYLKRVNRANGDGFLHDSEVQSALHEHTHALEGMPEHSTEDQIAFAQHFIAQVEADPTLTDAEKYRPYTGKAGQTGIVTRLREEVEILKTGRDRHGRPVLGTVRENTARHMAAVMRMGAITEHLQPAKRNFLETNARTRGISMKDAEREWKQLMEQPGDFSQISLNDSFRDDLGSGPRGDETDTRPRSLQESLAMAGMSARDQAELGQSGRARNAMAVMERRRLDALAKLPSRNTFDAPGVVSRNFLDPKNKNSYIKCTECGQFGHDASACHNDDLVAERRDIEKRSERLDRSVEANKYRMLEQLPDDALHDHLTKLRAIPVIYSDVAAFRQSARDTMRDIAGGEPLSEVQIAKQRTALEREKQQLRAEFDARGGTLSGFKSLDYSPHTGVLKVTPQDTMRGPATPFMMRVSPQQWADLTDGSDAIGRRLNQLGLAGTIDEAYRFENAADLAAASTQHKCPTCGQWASMNTAHRCPVKGGPSEEYQARNAALNAQYRAALREGGSTLPPRPRNTRVAQPVERKVCSAMELDGTKVQGSLVTATRASIDADLATDTTLALPSVQAKFPGATVSGQVRLWNDRDQRYMSVFNSDKKPTLKCTCAQYRATYRCPHVQAVAATTAMKFAAAPARERSPESTYDTLGGMSLDAPLSATDRVDYATIMRRRDDSNADFVDAVRKRSYAGELMNAPVTTPPRTTAGEQVLEPTVWGREPSVTDDDSDAAGRRSEVPKVDLQDTRAVVYRLRKVLSGRGPRRSYSVRTDSNGGITIDVQKSAKNTAAAETQRRELRQLLNLPANNNLSTGYYIPPTGSARFEALDRAYGDPQRIKQSRMVLAADQASLARQHAERVANRNQF